MHRSPSQNHSSLRVDGLPEPAHVTPAAVPAARRSPARCVDVVVVGGGLAGSAAAAVLGRAGREVVLVDPHETVPSDFRCEKLDPGQFQALARLGLSGPVERAATRSRDLWVARRGRLIDTLAVDQHGILYPDLVSAVRSAWPERVAPVHRTVSAIVPSEDRQFVRLADGEAIDARLVVLANGANRRLRQSIGMSHHVVSAQHSLTIGFDVARADGRRFPFDSLTYFAERPSDRLAYLTLFRIGSRMRANLMTYRLPSDPDLESLAPAPEAVIHRLMPGLRAITGDFTVTSPTRPRPVDLSRTGGLRIPGVVVIGDAFANSCPAAGTGTSKIFSDVGRLCSVHIPRWLASPGMGADKITAFYDDPLKQAVDRMSFERAVTLRHASIDTDLYWRLVRLAGFGVRAAKGTARRLMASGFPARRSVQDQMS